MPLQNTLRIHIAPQGYEDERIFKPAIEYKADKVYLLVTDDDDQSEDCQNTVEAELDDADIEHEAILCNIFNPDESIQAMSKIIRQHPDDDVKVNISTGSKITAISGMFACMMSDASPYYVRAEDYGDEPVSKGVKDIFELPAYPIDPPDRDFVEVLSFLEDREDDGEEVKIRDLNTFIQNAELDVVQGIKREDDENIYDIVNDEVIDPLIEKGFIRKNPFGGSKYITITKRGKQTLDFSRHLIEE